MEASSEGPLRVHSRSKVTVVSSKSQFDIMDDRNIYRRMTISDKYLDNTEVYCLVPDILDEQQPSYDQVMNSDHRDQWLQARKFR